VKYRKTHKGHRRGNAQAGNTVVFGDFGLQALEPAWITSRQIESARRAITHHIRRGGNIWIRIFPDKPVTKKPAETRMGGGKGSPDHWVAEVAKEAMRLASHKLPIATRFVIRDSGTAVSGDSKSKELAKVEG